MQRSGIGRTLFELFLCPGLVKVTLEAVFWILFLLLQVRRSVVLCPVYLKCLIHAAFAKDLGVEKQRLKIITLVLSGKSQSLTILFIQIVLRFVAFLSVQNLVKVLNNKFVYIFIFRDLNSHLFFWFIFTFKYIRKNCELRSDL